MDRSKQNGRFLESGTHHIIVTTAIKVMSKVYIADFRSTSQKRDK